MNKNKQMTEALKRMKTLKIHPNAINEFEKEGKVNVSTLNLGVLYWASDEQNKYIKAFEKEYNALVYHVIHNNTSIGEMLTMLYVSEHEEEWADDNKCLKEEGYAYAYVENLTDPICSEIGGVMVEPINGGVRRTA